MHTHTDADADAEIEYFLHSMSAHNGPEISHTFARELEDDLAQMLVHLCLRMLPVDGNHLLRCGVQTAKKLIENSHEGSKRPKN